VTEFLIDEAQDRGVQPSGTRYRPTMETINVMSAKIDQDDDNRPFNNNNNNNDNNNSSETEHLDKNWNIKKDDRDASHLLSRRCHVTAGSRTGITNFMFAARFRWSENAFDEDSNPGGIVNVGTAENKVAADILNAKIEEISRGIWSSKANHLNYFEFRGLKSVRTKVANFLERYFAKRHKDCNNHSSRIDPNHVFITNGCGPALEVLGHVIADEGDVILSPTPHYKRIQNNFEERGLVGTIYIPLTSATAWQLSVEDVKRGFEKAVADGKRVRGLVLVNPHNPLGYVLDRGTMWSILQFCRDHQIHVIFDEIYRLCVFKGRLSECTSILQFGKNIPDPERTHFVWSMSKDFGMSGYRFGVIYTHSELVAKALGCFSYFNAVPSLIQDIVGEMLSDYDWIDHQFLPVCNRMFNLHLSMIESSLTEAGIPYFNGMKGGLFFWVFVGDFLQENTFDAERQFTEYLMVERGCYVLPGSECDSPEPGWIRIVFTVSTKELEVFLERFTNAIKDEVGECRCEDEACCGSGSGGCDDGGYDVVESEEGAAKNGEGGGGDKSEGDGIAKTGEEMDNLREEGDQGAADGLIEEQGEITLAKGSNDEEMKQEESVGDDEDDCRCEEKSREEDDTENVEEGPVQLPNTEHERPHDEPDKNANCYHEEEEEAVPRIGYGPTRDCDGSYGNQSSRTNWVLSPQRRYSGQQPQKKEEKEEEGEREGYEESSRLKYADNSAGKSRGATIAASSAPLDATSTKFALSFPSGASPVTSASSKSAAKATSASASATVRKYIEDANFQFVPRSRRGSGGAVGGRGSGRGRGTSAKCDDADDDGSQWQKFYFE